MTKSLFTAILIAAQAATTTPHPTSQTAISLSHIAVGASKIAIRDGFANGDFRESVYKCSTSIDDDLVKNEYQSYLEKNLTGAEFQYLNSFFSRPIGNKYIQYTLNQVSMRNTGKPGKNISLSESEIDELNRIGASPVGAKLGMLVSRNNQEHAATIKPPLLAAIAACKSAP